MYLNYFKLDAKIYTYEVTTFFGTAEDDFEAWYNNLKKLFTPYC